MVKYIHVDRCDSTQDLLKEQLTLEPETEWTISCEHQTQGKGRGSNTWIDTAGTLCFSMSITPHLKPSFTALELSVLVCRFFEGEGKKLKLKWPNDIQNKFGKKCAGLLVQTSSQHCMAGLGVNLFFEGSDFGGVYDSTFQLNKEFWCKNLSHFIRQHRYIDTSLLTQDWDERCSQLNQEVTISESNVTVQGIFRGLGQFGEALIENQDGFHRLYNGSLRLV